MKRSRVLILGLFYPPANFMAGRRLEGWARHLPAFGYDPHVLTRYYDPEERDRHDFYASTRPTHGLHEPWIQTNGAVYTQFRQSRWSRLPIPGKIRGLAHYAWPDPDHYGWYRQCVAYLDASGYKPDLIIGSYGPPAVLAIAGKLARRFNVPWVADFRDTWVDLFDESTTTRLKYLFQRRLVRSAASITAVSQGVMEALRNQLLPLAKPTHVIYNGAEPFDDVQPDPRDKEIVARFRQIVERNHTVLTYSGTLYPPQQIDHLFSAVGKLNSQNGRSYAIVLCGKHDPAQFSHLPFVHVLGPVAHRTALFLQKESSAGFYPTWWPEKHTGFSGKVFEMILSGRPALVFSTPPADLKALAERFSSLRIIESPETLIAELPRLSEQSGESEGTRALATKKHAVKELARVLDSVLRNDSTNNP